MPLTATTAADLFRSPPHDHVPVGDGEVAVRTVGSGPDVLFVHGWPAGGATFRGLLPVLAQHLTCHVVDLVGAGDSRFDRSTELTLARHVADVRTVVDALGLQDLAVVGHDSGGLIARHALAGDGRVRSWGLVDTELPQGLHWRFASFLWAGRLPGFARVLAWAGQRPRLRRNPFLLGDCFHDRSLLAGDFAEFVLDPLAVDPDRRWAAGELVRHFDTAFVDELADVHARIDVPVQLVWGADDPFFPLAWAQEAVTTFADGRLHAVADAKLFVHEEHPDEVAHALLPVLRGG